MYRRTRVGWNCRTLQSLGLVLDEGRPRPECSCRSPNAHVFARRMRPLSTVRFFAASISFCELARRPRGVAQECTNRQTGTYPINAHAAMTWISHTPSLAGSPAAGAKKDKE